ncbi:MAG: hypothetical protein ACD_23C00982G0001, partial [uncultured bacterium]
MDVAPVNRLWRACQRPVGYCELLAVNV